MVLTPEILQEQERIAGMRDPLGRAVLGYQPVRGGAQLRAGAALHSRLCSECGVWERDQYEAYLATTALPAAHRTNLLLQFDRDNAELLTLCCEPSPFGGGGGADEDAERTTVSTMVEDLQKQLVTALEDKLKKGEEAARDNKALQDKKNEDEKAKSWSAWFKSFVPGWRSAINLVCGIVGFAAGPAAVAAMTPYMLSSYTMGGLCLSTSMLVTNDTVRHKVSTSGMSFIIYVAKSPKTAMCLLLLVRGLIKDACARVARYTLEQRYLLRARDGVVGATMDGVADVYGKSSEVLAAYGGVPGIIVGVFRNGGRKVFDGHRAKMVAGITGLCAGFAGSMGWAASMGMSVLGSITDSALGAMQEAVVEGAELALYRNYVHQSGKTVLDILALVVRPEKCIRDNLPPVQWSRCEELKEEATCTGAGATNCTWKDGTCVDSEARVAA